MEITKWEYETIRIGEKEKLRDLGRKGWEAFASDNGSVVLKRPCGRLKVIEKVNGVEINNTDNEIDR